MAEYDQSFFTLCPLSLVNVKNKQISSKRSVSRSARGGKINPPKWALRRNVEVRNTRSRHGEISTKEVHHEPNY